MTGRLDPRHGYCIEDLEAGMSATITKTFTDQDVAAYARVSMDDNPLHLSEEFAATTRVGGRVVHGMITASLISALIGTRLPGPGCLWMSQELRFVKPVRVGDAVRAHAWVETTERSKQRVRLTTVCTVGDATVLTGSALVWVPSRSTATPSSAG